PRSRPPRQRRRPEIPDFPKIARTRGTATAGRTMPFRSEIWRADRPVWPFGFVPPAHPRRSPWSWGNTGVRRIYDHRAVRCPCRNEILRRAGDHELAFGIAVREFARRARRDANRIARFHRNVLAVDGNGCLAADEYVDLLVVLVAVVVFGVLPSGVGINHGNAVVFAVEFVAEEVHSVGTLGLL